MANLPLSPSPRRDLGRRAVADLRDRISGLTDAFPQLRIPGVRWALGVLALIVLLGVGTAILAFYLMFAPIELPEPIEGAKAATTQILGADGSVIEQWHGPINRTPVHLSKMSQHLQDAAVAAEDARFYRRGAVDLRAVLRAAGANLMRGAFVQGGSTISQQYAKNVYVGNARSISRKIHEARVAYRLERDVGKDRVLEGYLNTVYFGRGAYGVEAASKIYFGKPALDVTASEAALLVSLIRSPDGYSPYFHPDRSEARRRWVLERMTGQGMLSPSESDKAVRQSPVLTPASDAHPRYGWYLDAVRTYLLRRYGSEKVYAGGLKVQTTIDPQAQEAAEATIANALPDSSDPYAALVSIDPATGYVRALVGGRDYSNEKYNIALQGRRQPGSAFKPLVLVAALEEGIPVSAGYRAPGKICPKGWRPSCVSNFGRSGYGWMNLEQATINSVNTVYAQLVLEVGPRKVVDVARRMGIPGPAWMPPRSACRPTADDPCGTQLQPVPAMALGAEEVTPLELASAYATLAAGGVYREPKLVARVEDAAGRVLEEGPSAPKQAISPSVAETVNGILSKVITQGTGTRADFGRPAAGKTGTAQDFSNAWFSGYTPQLATAVWVGHRQSNQPLLNVHGIRQVAGGTLPAEMWREYMKGVSDRTPPKLELGAALEDGAFTPERTLSFEGRAADGDGMVQGIELSIDEGPFASAGVTCKECPDVDVRWRYESPSPLTDGEHVAAIRSFDKAGHRSEPQVRRITVDTRPPAIEKAEATGGSAGVKVRFDEPVACGSISPGSFAVTVDGRRATVGSAGCTGSSSAGIELALTKPVRGGDQITVDLGRGSRSPRDSAGNRAASEPVRVAAANSEPVVAVDPVAGAGPFAAEEVEITGSAEDRDGTLEGLVVSVDDGPFSAAGLRCRDCGRLAGASWVYRPPAPLGHGKHVLTFRSTDNAGAMSKRRSRMLVVDAVAPSLDSVAATGGNPVVKAGFTEPISCAGLGPSAFETAAGRDRLPVRSVLCSGQASEVLELTLGEPVRGGERLSLSIRDRSGAPTDVAGNRSRLETRSAEASNIVPVLNLSPDPEKDARSGPGVQIAGSTADPDGTVEAVEVSVDDGPFSAAGVDCSRCGKAGETAWSYQPESPLSNGRHRLAFRSVDNAGESSPPSARSVTVDSVAPSILEVSSAGGNPLVEVKFSEPLSCAGNAAGQFRVSVGGRRSGVRSVLCEGAAARLNLSRTPRGGERVDVVVRGPSRSLRDLTDAAGNPASGGSRSATAGNAAPVLTIEGPGPELLASTLQGPARSIEIRGSATDPDGIIEAVEVGIDDGPFSTQTVKCRGCGRSQEVSFSIEVESNSGVRGISVRAKDRASALSSPATFGLTRDSERPVLKAISGRAGASTVTARFSEPLDCSTVDRSDFAVTAKGDRRTVLTAQCSADARQVNLRISGRVTDGSVTVKVLGILEDAAQNAVEPGALKRIKVRKID